jgi:hypothetical protein
MDPNANELTTTLTSDITSIKVKVSSVQNNNSSQYGKQFMFDNNDDTAWYSEQGKFQYVMVFFPSPCNISKIELTGSGGFCPKV